MDATAKRIAAAEARIARQEQIVAEMDRDHHPKAAAQAREVLQTLRETLRVMKETAALRTQLSDE